MEEVKYTWCAIEAHFERQAPSHKTKDLEYQVEASCKPNLAVERYDIKIDESVENFSSPTDSLLSYCQSLPILPASGALYKIKQHIFHSFRIYTSMS